MSDQSLFIFSDNAVTTFFLVYVDNIILATSCNDFVSMVITKLGNDFTLKDMGPLSFFLGIQLTNLGNVEILISQQQYLATLLENLELQNLKPADTLMEAKMQFLASDVLDDFGQRHYRQIVGSLQFLIAT